MWSRGEQAVIGEGIVWGFTHGAGQMFFTFFQFKTISVTFSDYWHYKIRLGVL